jgi:hypothetical protein
MIMIIIVKIIIINIGNRYRLASMNKGIVIRLKNDDDG